MSEYLAPGVFVEEIPTAPRQIEGVSTSTAGFVGATRFGPLAGRLPRLTCLADFERIYGDAGKLAFGRAKVEHQLWHAARAFFAEGGKALYVARVFRPRSRARSGVASARVGRVVIRARHPGAYGNFRLRLTAATAAAADGALLTVTVTTPEGTALGTWHDLAIAGRGGQNDGSGPFELFAASSAAAELPIVGVVDGRMSAGEILDALFAGSASAEGNRTTEIALRGGNDGTPPQPEDYAGFGDSGGEQASGFRRLEAIDDIAIVAAPGAAAAGGATDVARVVLAHAEKMRYRMAVLDAGPGQGTAAVHALRADIDSKNGALFMPWLLVADPRGRRKVAVPPSGFVAGRWNRLDRPVAGSASTRALDRLAVGLEQPITEAEQQAANADAINVFRSIPGHGIVQWGDRTLSTDPEWRYVPVRRYLAYLEQSIDRGTRWAVFESDSEPLWAKLRASVENFLLGEWRGGALVGDKPEAAFFVRCDRTTMTQADLDNGRVICIVGVAPVRPAEFVIIRIGQWTRDHKPCA